MASNANAEGGRLDRAEISAVWKDGGNEKWGLKLDLVKHLLQQRDEPQWTACKDRLLAVLALHEATTPMSILDVGCGLGIDTLAMAQALGKSQHGGRIVGVDMNTAMMTYAKGAAEEASIADNIRLEYHQADLTALSIFPDGTFDIVRSDITLQHIQDISAALKEIARVLKPGGRLVTLEGSPGGFYSRDEMIRTTYNRVMPAQPNGGTGVQLYFKVQEHGFSIRTLEVHSIVNSGASAARADPGWVKLKGTGAMLVDKKILTADESTEYQKRYIAAAESQGLLTLGFVMLQVAQKQ